MGLDPLLPPSAAEGSPPPQVAGTWHSMAMAASDISLLDSASTPLRMYVQELRPTPEDNLEILTSQRWVCRGPPMRAWLQGRRAGGQTGQGS